MKNVSVAISIALSLLGAPSFAATLGPSMGTGEFGFDGLGYFGIIDFNTGTLTGSSGFFVLENTQTGFLDIDGTVFSFDKTSIVGNTLVVAFEASNFALSVDAGTISDPIAALDASLDPFESLFGVEYTLYSPVTAVPVPATLPLALLGLASIFGISRRK